MFLRKLSHQVARRAIHGRPSMRASTSQISCAMNTREMSSAAGATLLEQLAVESPHVDVIRYEHKNVKFTLQNVDANSSALAYGLLESGLKPGNVVLSWLPSHFAEEVCFVLIYIFTHGLTS